MEIYTKNNTFSTKKHINIDAIAIIYPRRVQKPCTREYRRFTRSRVSLECGRLGAKRRVSKIVQSKQKTMQKALTKNDHRSLVRVFIK